MMQRYTIKKTVAQAPALLDSLNEEQRAVVRAAAGPLLVLAGAGSGKTRVLTYRLAQRLADGVSPESIVLLTFTNRAAKEMMSRAAALCGADAEKICGGTFHSVALTHLRKHAALLGFNPNFSVLSGEDRLELMDSLMAKQSSENENVSSPYFPHAKLVLELCSLSINTLTPLVDLIRSGHARLSPWIKELCELANAFVAKKMAMNAMDFDDLLLNFRQLLINHENVLVGHEQRVVFVDEYQDVNALQAAIVDLLAHKSRDLTVVGDDAQCIYGFRGASVEAILDFPKRYGDARILALTTNYRSTPDILGLANHSLHFMGRGFKKELVPTRASGALPAIVSCKDALEQAAFVVERLLELRDEGAKLRDMAVLYRSHHHAMELQLELLRRRVPFQVRSGLKFFETAHVRDVLAHLKLAENPKDEMSFHRAIRLRDGIGAKNAELLFGFWQSIDDVGQVPEGILTSMTLRLKTKSARQSLSDFVSLMTALKGANASVSFRIGFVLSSFYKAHLESRFANPSERLDDIRQLMDYGVRFSDTAAFLNDLCLLGDFGAMRTAGSDEGEDEDKVVLSTIHQAKGLEWRHVFVLWLAEGRFPSEFALRERDGVDEERRLFYVALTRARDSIALCYPLMQKKDGSSAVLLRRSRFVEEIFRPLLSGQSPKVEQWILESEGTQGVELAIQ
jgi:DNA helicase-2/ATP-dependent DNA helicase PcrA